MNSQSNKIFKGKNIKVGASFGIAREFYNSFLSNHLPIAISLLILITLSNTQPSSE